MKVTVKNLGVLKQAEFELGDLTIICGENNTGKTYATYALFGFLTMWEDVFPIKIPETTVNQLLSEGAATLELDQYIQDAEKILEAGCASYTRRLPMVFASRKEYFQSSQFQVKLEKETIRPRDTFERNFSSSKAQIFNITKHSQESHISITLLAEKEKIHIPKQIIGRLIGIALKEVIFGHLFPKPFIASAERTGAAIFRKELNFARNRMLEQVSGMEKEIDPLEFLNKVYSDYALPVKSNVDFTRQLEDLYKQESYIVATHPSLIHDFSMIIGGEYKVLKENICYIPKTNKRLRLSMDESSSAVRSLLDIGFYLRHVAQKGDLLMVDEPELNLHPENQRRVARLFARLINIGIKVFITTHSDYIIKELNTLIMLNRDEPHLKTILKKEGYKEEELLSADQVRVYIAEEKLCEHEGNKRKIKCHTLVPAGIDPELGIEAPSFDNTINSMNRIQQSIIFGGK